MATPSVCQCNRGQPQITRKEAVKTVCARIIYQELLHIRLLTVAGALDFLQARCPFYCTAIHDKVTICPDFIRTVPNFDGLSREDYEVSWDAELSLIPNSDPILSHSECNVTSHWRTLYSQAKYLHQIRCRQKCSFEPKMHQIHFWLGLCLWCSPDHSRLGRGYPFPYTSPRCLWCRSRCLCHLEQCPDFLS